MQILFKNIFKIKDGKNMENILVKSIYPLKFNTNALLLANPD